MSSDTAIVPVILHRRFLRRFSKLPPGTPNSFNCHGGFHESLVSIGDFVGQIARGSPAEKALTPSRVDSRWPRKCDRCTYRFTQSDRWQLIAVTLSEADDD